MNSVVNMNSRLISGKGIYGMPQCVFSMDYVYEDFVDVDYIDSCGKYMTTIASALTLVVTLEL